MSCKICGRGACASWMHSAEENSEWESLEDFSEHKLKKEIISLRGEVKDLKKEIENLKDEVVCIEKDLNRALDGN